MSDLGLKNGVIPMNLNINEIDKNTHIHFIGVGGISMSALAEILLSKGFAVSGSDIHCSDLISHLETLGLKFYLGHSSENLTNAGLVVYTVAVKEDNPEMQEAKRRGIPCIQRSVLLGALMRDYKYSIAISGTHGKTTVTSMLSYILMDLQLDPTILVGADLDILHGNIHSGHGSYFLAEACEYHRSFLDFSPYCATILNVEPDHLDYYKDAQDYRSAYRDFSALVHPDGFLCIPGDDEAAVSCAQSARCRIVTFGLGEHCQIQGRQIVHHDSHVTYDLYVNGTFVQTVTLSVFGDHNVLNSLAALANVYAFGLSLPSAISSLRKFKGAHRRLEYRGDYEGIHIYDDYAHHPTEIQATIKAVQDIPHNRFICIFQPHTYSRTKALLEQFSTCFAGVDTLILTDIYAAREANDPSVHSKMLSQRIQNAGVNAIYISDFSDIVAYIKENAKPGDLVMTMGAGNVYAALTPLVPCC